MPPFTGGKCPRPVKNVEIDLRLWKTMPAKKIPDKVRDN